MASCSVASLAESIYCLRNNLVRNVHTQQQTHMLFQFVHVELAINIVEHWSRE